MSGPLDFFIKALIITKKGKLPPFDKKTKGSKPKGRKDGKS